MARSGLDFARSASVRADMAEQSTVAAETSLTSKLLAGIWSRLEEAERLATGNMALESLPRIAALADQAALLARAVELVRDDAGE